ncbi:MAG TPA: bifunctional adenosylcobinamide kinase/adenosylcobinamide-phosphate guanylyltransferase [Actinomycetota bacterium]
MPVTVLIGGARSGKSALAIRMARAAGTRVALIATAEPRDAEMAARIARHRAERPADWATVEEPLDLGTALTAVVDDDFVVLDCLTLWVSNAMEAGLDDETIGARAAEHAKVAAARPGGGVVVTNEVGLGIVPAHEVSRRYRDVLGRVNAIWCDAADEALLLVAGRALRLERLAR